MKIRPERVAHRMRREIADILANRMRDPRMSSWVSVTDVELTGDLAFARVYVSLLPEGAERDEAMKVLSGAAGFVRRQLASRLGLREVPEIKFLLDTSIEKGARVDEILRRLSLGEPVGQDEEDSGER